VVYKIRLIHALMLLVSCHWNLVITIIKTTSEVGDGDGMRDWLAGDSGRGRSGRGRHTRPCQPARSRCWVVEVRMFTLHTGAGWAWWRVSMRPRLGAF